MSLTADDIALIQQMINGAPTVGEGFAQPIVAGQNLLIPGIQSPNYVHDVSGWAILKNGSAEFQDIILPSGRGIAATFSATAPASPNVGDLWYDTAAGLEVSQWDGSAWVAFQIGSGAIAPGGIATGNIASGAITNALLAASAVATANIQAGAITAAQISAAAGILGTQLATGAITNTELAGSVTARSLGGITTTIAGSAPASPVAGDIWIDSANGYQIQQYSGSAWTPVTWTATDVIAAGSITASLIAANTITASQIAAGTITASQIAAGTITSSLLAAGIVVAGIVNGTTISAATFNGSTYNGTDFIINSSGSFFYSSTPAAGNLVVSVTTTSGTDGFGNAYLGGTTGYVQISGSLWEAVQIGTVQGMAFYSAPSYAGPWTEVGAIQTGNGDVIISPNRYTNSQTPVALLNVSTPSGLAGYTLAYGNSGRLGLVGPSGLAMSAPGAQPATFTVNTVTQATLNNLASFTITANDAAAGTVYEIEAWGNGTWGSTAQTLEFAVSLGGNTMSNLTLGSSYFAASQAFRWRIAGRVICHTTGSNGTWTSLVFGEVTAFGNNLLVQNGSQATGAVVSCESTTTTTVDTTADETFALQAAWGSTTGAPTISKRVSLFKRIAG